jgi:putative membrane-bound dehydrogenase-like protein
MRWFYSLLPTPYSLLALLLALALPTLSGAEEKLFRAGAFAIDVTPLELPVIVNGGMTERSLDKIEDRLHARCLVLDDGTAQLAIVIVDSCMMPRDLLDEAKRMASAATKIPPDRILIAATHAHSAPSVFGCLGSDADEKYSKFLPVQIAKGIQQAHANLQPARIGWAVGRDSQNVASRRWLMKPGVAPTNEYSGKANDRAMMYPGPANRNAIAALGIIDSDVPVLSVQTKDGRPLAVLTNYSMHYVGAPNLSADYFAVVCDKLTEHVKPSENSPFVAMHSNGTSGDQWLMDYTKPRREFDRFTVGASLAEAAYEAYQRIFYYDWVPLVMAESELELAIRQPSADELAAATKLVDTFKDRKPKTLLEVYAREAVLLSQMPARRKIKLQALRIGELGIAAIPNEVFSSTGLQIKIESPTPTTFTIELANGAEGYIPTPKQHKLGGYETWRARSSCLEVTAEPKIRAAVLELLNKVNETRAAEEAILTPEPPKTSAVTPKALDVIAHTPAFTPKAFHLIAQGRAAHPGYVDHNASQPQRGWINAPQRDGTPSGFVNRGRERTQGAPKTATLGYGMRPLRGQERFISAVDEATGPKPPVKSPLSPDDALKHFKIRDGFQIELVASEPQIVDPVAFDWGFDGRLWVVEMHDYPNGLGAAGPNDKGPPGGRVKVLEDADGNGHYEKSTTFAEGLSFPNGLMAMPDGSVLVTASPQILRLKDTDNDGKADEQEVLFSGFAEGNQQLRVNGLKWGLEGWIYCANGGVGRGDPKARIKVERTGELVDVGARDFRFSLDYKQLVPELGMSQFGRNRDDFGNWFGCNNNTALYHIVHDDAMLRRNPHLIPAATTVFVPQITKPGPVYAISEKGRFWHDSEVGRFTSANSAMIYRDRLLGEEFYGNFFVSEPVHNLVHREIVEPSGVTFTSHRAPGEKKTEFLASSDTWFRPNMIRTGLDGALYVSDMYREIIEHPGWIQPEKKADLTFRNGDDRGRIWRITKQGVPPRKVPQLAKLTVEERIGLLQNESGELRDKVQMQITGDNTPFDELAKMSREGARAEHRLLALCALQSLDALSPQVLTDRLSDVDPRVRRGALRLTRGRLARDSGLAEAALARLTDKDAGVRLELAYALGTWPDLRAGDGLAQLLLRARNDAVLRDAVLSSLSAENIEVVAAALSRSGPSAQMVVAALGPKFGRGQILRDALQRRIPKEGGSIEQLAETLDGLSEQGVGYAELNQYLQDQELSQRLEALMATAREVAERGPTAQHHLATPEASYFAAIRLMGRSGQLDRDVALLTPYLAPKVATQLQCAAAAQLLQLATPQTPQLLLKDWKGHSPALRAEILDGLLARDAWADALLSAIETETVAPGDLDAARRQRLLQHPNPKIKERSAKLLVTSGSSDRQEVIAQWSDKVLALPGDAVRGKAEFTKRCATCHKWQGEGQNVGPDLNTLTDRSPKMLLTAILDPNLQVEPKYQSYAITTEEGKILSGMLVEETATSITLADAGGKRINIGRNSILQLQATGRSLMPDGLERDVTPESLADILKLLSK